MTKPEQWTIEYRIGTEPYRGDWRKSALIGKAKRALRRAVRANRQTLCDTPPPAPVPPLEKEAVFMDGPFRFLMAWVPDWSPTRNAGYYVIRADVLSEK